MNTTGQVKTVDAAATTRLTNWTSSGYPRLAQLMGAYPEVAIIRRFGTLNALNLLSLQAELLELEDQYKLCVEADNECTELEMQALSGDFWKLHRSSAEQRKLLIDEIRPRLDKYNNFILQLARIERLRKPNDTDLHTLRDWLVGEKEGNLFLRGTEAETWDEINNRDFVTLDGHPEDKAAIPKWLNPRLVDWYYYWRPPRKAPKYVDLESGRVFDTDESKVVRSCRVFSRLIGTVVASLIPALAIFALNAVEDTQSRIGMTIAFTAAFCMCLFLFTNATMKEIYTAAATFAAVEVVFIGTAVPIAR